MMRTLVYILAIFCLISQATRADSEIKRIDKIQSGNTIVRHFLYNPVGFWKFEEGSGVIAGDSSGVGNNGTINGATWTTGKIGQALSFDGVNNYVAASSAVNPGASDFTLSFWFYPTDFNTFPAGYVRTILSQQNGTGTGRGWIYIYDINSHLNSSLGSVFGDSGFTLSLNTWVQATLVHNNAANTLTWYVNGVARNTNTGVAIESATGNYILGAQKDVTKGLYAGILDDVRIYNRALTVDEIQRLYFLGQQ